MRGMEGRWEEGERRREGERGGTREGERGEGGRDRGERGRRETRWKLQSFRTLKVSCHILLDTDTNPGML